MGEQVLFQFRDAGSQPSVDDVAARFGFQDDDLDRSYGVVKVADEPRGALYAVQVDAAARDRVGPAVAEDPDPAVGFFANPPIEPFGPPQP